MGDSIISTVQRALDDHRQELKGSLNGVGRGDSDSSKVLQMLQDQRSDIDRSLSQVNASIKDIRSDAIPSLQRALQEKGGADQQMLQVQRTMQTEMEGFLAEVVKAIRENLMRTEVDLQPVYKWIQSHSGDMANYLVDINNAVRNISIEQELATIHRAVKDIRTELDVAPLLKAILDHRQDFETHTSNFHKAMRDSKMEIDWQNISRMIREALRENSMDIKPIQSVVREAKMETEQVLTQMVKTTSELHSAVCWTIPSKLDQIHSQGETVLSNHGLVETSLRTLADKISDLGSRSLQRSDDGVRSSVFQRSDDGIRASVFQRSDDGIRGSMFQRNDEEGRGSLYRGLQR